MAQKIPLSRGQFALVDDEDFAKLSAHSWIARPNAVSRGGFYACRLQRTDGAVRTLYMHREILQPPPGVLVDHVNCDGLDNRRSNLRLCTKSQNSMNSLTRNSSGFRGVVANKCGANWAAELQIQGRRIRVHGLPTPELAARVYDALAREFHGEFATLNFTDRKDAA